MTEYLTSACEGTFKHGLDSSTDDDPTAVLREPRKRIIDDDKAIQRLVKTLARTHDQATKNLYHNDVAMTFAKALLDFSLGVDSMFEDKFR